MKMTKYFSENLRILRKTYGLTQDELAKSINTSRSCISNYESGLRLPDSTTLTLMADVFNVSADYMLGRSPVKTVMHDENILAMIYDCIEKAKSTETLDISNASAKIRCAVAEFYSYLASKENTEI